ncbi:coadhesin-like [Mytilus galloprovincialis]|uniref:coadhesin-like n=1 Tax=Mytilus galloprovincialis TaxID=29158 RepID=UPI003F7C5B9B
MWKFFLLPTTLFICTRVANGQIDHVDNELPDRIDIGPQPEPVDNDGKIKLSGGNNPEEGRLLIYHNSQWGTICGDNFGTSDAVVACRQLGYRTSMPIVYTIGGGSDPIWLDDMGCDGTELRIANCRHPGWNIHNCNHGEDVGVRCTGEYGVNGNWGCWSTWSFCNSSCGSGTIQRTRLCDSPSPAFNGLPCTGDSNESQPCTGSFCLVNGNWGSWSVWTVCSSSCDSGHQTRSRLCNNPVPSSNGAYCNGNSFDVFNCNIARCRVNGNWGSWSVWTACSSSCDSGHQTRSRLCNNPAPSSNGAYCYGKSFEVLNCSIASCTVNGIWGSWSVWTICSSSCDSGHQTRSRLCNNPLPSSNGAYCNGKSFEVLNCSITTCTVNGNWGSWSHWTICSSSCDAGHQTRSRICNNPVPSPNGAYCNGKSFEVLNCSIAMCTVNGNWGSWSDWTVCSSSCDSGHQTRSRLCNNPVPSSSGFYCNGKSFGVLNCSIARCAVDGSWGGWSKWSDCNATCDGGVQKRTRTCNNPYPSAGGSACSGMADQILICAESDCPVLGAWSEWGVWSLCSTSCGSGNRTRNRLCDNPPPSHGGEYCNGKTLDTDTCNTHECPTDNCLCFNGGKCVTSNDGKVVCDCIGQWTGEFCLESQCMTYDCGFGNCLVEPMNGTAQCVCGNKQPTYCTGKRIRFK